MELTTGIQAYTLSELTERIQKALTRTFEEQTYWVIADIASHSYYPNKEHHYFDLVEKDRGGTNMVAKLSAVAWRSGAARIRLFESRTGQRFRSGIQVLMRVSVDYHKVYGLKAVLQDIDPSFTLGQLELERQRTLDRLVAECTGNIRKEGDRFITRNNSLLHRTVIQDIAVLASGASAGYQDFMHTLVHNPYGYQFTVTPFFTVTQGEGHADAVARRLEDICATEKDFDAVVVIRGGGADTDFLLFDQFALCRAVAELSIPVITGIGHQKNETITDLMAHTPTKTPTMAAKFIIGHNRAFEERISALQQLVIIKSQKGVARYVEQLSRLKASVTHKSRTLLGHQQEDLAAVQAGFSAGVRRLLYRQEAALRMMATGALQQPRALLANQQFALEMSRKAIASAARNGLSEARHLLQQQATILRLLSPANTLKRGYALVYRDGKIQTDGKDIREGDVLQVQVQDGVIDVTVNQKSETDGDPFKL